MGFTALAPVDRFLERHRIRIVAATLAAVALACAIPSPPYWRWRRMQPAPPRCCSKPVIEAGAFALCAVALLLIIARRRISDMLLLVPLVIAGLVTLELCVVLDLPLNFANVLALPLLLGVGVAFKIHYIRAWRAGKTALQQSSLTRAVVFSAMTTATGFGSLWLSNHPGTSSMGKLMVLALATTMTAIVFFQPALMGPPRTHVG